MPTKTDIYDRLAKLEAKIENYDGKFREVKKAIDRNVIVVGLLFLAILSIILITHV